MEDKKKKIEQQKQLPEEVIFEHILTRFPIKSLLQFKLVSKQWYSILSSDYHFAISQFNLSPFSNPSSPTKFLLIKSDEDFYVFSYDDHDDVDFDIDNDNDEGDPRSDFVRSKVVKLEVEFDDEETDFIVVGSCHGLVCLGDQFGYDFILWNPVTNQSKKFYSDPNDLDRFKSYKFFHVNWGFGYVSSLDDYKVVRIVEATSTEDIIVHVFSLRSNKWSSIDVEQYQHAFSSRECGIDPSVEEMPCYPRSFHSSCGKLVGETLYWALANLHVRGSNIVAFDLVVEKFDISSDLSMNDKENGLDCDFLSVLGGCLTKRYYIDKHVNPCYNVWIRMLKLSGEEEKMCIERDLGLVRVGQNLVGFTRTGKLLTVMGSQLCLIDPDSQGRMHNVLREFKLPVITHITGFAPGLIQPSSIQFRSIYER